MTTIFDTEPNQLDSRSRHVPAIYAALNAVQRALGKFEKSGRGPSSQGSYPFLPVDDIVARLAPALLENGVITVPRITEAVQDTARFPKVNMNGEPIHDGRPPAIQVVSRIRYELDFVAVVDGSKITAQAYGESQDTGDKGLRRAATQAYKEILLRTFSIVTGEDDPDAFAPQDVEPAVVKQDRGEQMREKARAPRAAKAELPKAPAPEPERLAEQEAGPAPKEYQPVGNEPATVTEQVAQTQERVWTPDPADVAHAEANAPKAIDPAAPSVQPTAPPASKSEERAESVQDLRRAIREAYTARGETREYANTLGDHITGKPRAAWFANMTDLKRVLKAIENGEVAPTQS